jgi:hypothetical protein
MHDWPHWTRPALHPLAQRPRSQTSFAAQAAPHAPQFFASVRTLVQAPAHESSLGRHDVGDTDASLPPSPAGIGSASPPQPGAAAKTVDARPTTSETARARRFMSEDFTDALRPDHLFAVVTPMASASINASRSPTHVGSRP